MRFLYTGDWHLMGTNPRNRIDDYVAAVDAKLEEIFTLAVKWECEAIIVPGDIWNRPEVSISVLLHYAQLLSQSPVPIYTTPGNHDIYGYNIGTYERSSLRVLSMLAPNMIVFTDPTQPYRIVRGDEVVLLSFTPFTGRMDINGYGYSPEYENVGDGNSYRIHVAHGMLLDHEPPFDRYTLLQDVQTNANMVLTGHDHQGYGVYKRADGKIFCNPGAIARMAASQSEIARPVQVAIISTDRIGCGYEASIDLIPLTSAKPGEEVLDRSKIEAEAKRAYAMESFATLIQNHTGQKVIIDVNQIIEAIAKEENAAPHIVKAALEVIDQMREKVKP